MPPPSAVHLFLINLHPSPKPPLVPQLTVYPHTTGSHAADFFFQGDKATKHPPKMDTFNHSRKSQLRTSSVFLFSPPSPPSLTKGCVSPLTGGTWNRSISSIILTDRALKEIKTNSNSWSNNVHRDVLYVRVRGDGLCGSLFSQHDSNSLSSILPEVTRQQNSRTALLPGPWDQPDQSWRGLC